MKMMVKLPFPTSWPASLALLLLVFSGVFLSGATTAVARGEEAHEAEGTGREEKPPKITFEVPMGLEGLYTFLSDLQVSDIPQERPKEEVLFPNELGMNNLGGARFRLTPKLKVADMLQVVAQGDFSLYPFGEEPIGVQRSSDLRTRMGRLRDWRMWFNPRHLFVELRLPFGIVRAGQMGSHWGMGILANDGDKKTPFGLPFGGDIVERILFATKPFLRTGIEPLRDLQLVLAWDLVYDDITAKLYEGDIAWQAVAALRWDWAGQALGFYFVYRNQRKEVDGDERKLEVTVMDGYARFAIDFLDSLQGYAEGEIAYIKGKSNFAYSIHQPGGHDLKQFGGAGRLGLRWLEHVNVWLELGFASGDSNGGYDPQLRQFTMDPCHRIGLILFPEVLAWQSARAAEMAGHDEITGQDLPGIDLLPTNGGVSGAFYYNLVIKVRPLRWLEGIAGLVLARTSAHLLSPWETKNRGQPAGYLGGSVERKDLGVEVAYALWVHPLAKGPTLSMGLEAGYFWPGGYFTNADGRRMNDVWLASARLRLEY